MPRHFCIFIFFTKRLHAVPWFPDKYHIINKKLTEVFQFSSELNSSPFKTGFLHKDVNQMTFKLFCLIVLLRILEASKEFSTILFCCTQFWLTFQVNELSKFEDCVMFSTKKLKRGEKWKHNFNRKCYTQELNKTKKLKTLKNENVKVPPNRTKNKNN